MPNSINSEDGPNDPKSGYSSDSSSSSSSSDSSKSTASRKSSVSSVRSKEKKVSSESEKELKSSSEDETSDSEVKNPKTSESEKSDLEPENTPNKKSPVPRDTDSSSSSSSSEDEDTEITKTPEPETTKKEEKELTPILTLPKLLPPVETDVTTDETKSLKKVTITDDKPIRPRGANPKSARFNRQMEPSLPEDELIESELHIIKHRPTRSAPPRSRGFYAQSANLVYLQKECSRIERRMKKTAVINLVKKPSVEPYKPFTWNSLAPYYNTDTLRYIIKMPVNVRRGYNSRATACGLVDPEVSWKMDHCLTPYTPSRPELFRHHYSRRRTKSAAPRLITTDPTMVNPRFPRVPSAYSVGASGKSSPRPPSRKQAQTVH